MQNLPPWAALILLAFAVLRSPEANALPVRLDVSLGEVCFSIAGDSTQARVGDCSELASAALGDAGGRVPSPDLSSPNIAGSRASSLVVTSSATNIVFRLEATSGGYSFRGGTANPYAWFSVTENDFVNGVASPTPNAPGSAVLVGPAEARQPRPR